MDLDYVVRKAVSFCLAAATILIPGTLMLTALARALGAAEPLVLGTAGTMMALASVLLIQTFQEGLETRLQRVLFPTRYDHRIQLRQLSAELVHVVDRDTLVGRLGNVSSTFWMLICARYSSPTSNPAISVPHSSQLRRP